MGERFIDAFDVILVDMGLTFMFDPDRFSESEDYGTTYRRLGGTALEDSKVASIITGLFEVVMEAYDDPARHASFPRLSVFLAELPACQGLAPEERALLEEVFAAHEVGTVPKEHAQALHRLSRTHRLGLISNVWADSRIFREELRRAGVYDLFEALVFSSDHGCIKPARFLFDHAIDAVAADRRRTVYVGDSHERDVVGAARAGMSSVWINSDYKSVPPDGPVPDLVIRDLRDLV